MVPKIEIIIDTSAIWERQDILSVRVISVLMIISAFLL